MQAREDAAHRGSGILELTANARVVARASARNYICDDLFDNLRMNPLLKLLQPYPFERLRRLHADITPNPQLRPISLGIGEPRHATPELIGQALLASLAIGLLQTLAIGLDIKLGQWLGLPAHSALAQIELSQLAPLLPYALMVLVLLLRPRGLLGQRA